MCTPFFPGGIPTILGYYSTTISGSFSMVWLWPQQLLLVTVAVVLGHFT
jgi:hypothetical protein